MAWEQTWQGVLDVRWLMNSGESLGGMVSSLEGTGFEPVFSMVSSEWTRSVRMCDLEEHASRAPTAGQAFRNQVARMTHSVGAFLHRRSSKSGPLSSG